MGCPLSVLHRSGQWILSAVTNGFSHEEIKGKHCMNAGGKTRISHRERSVGMIDDEPYSHGARLV